jgi:hypothetical protein
MFPVFAGEVEHMVTVLGLLGGALLGTRYRVFCLVPVIVIGITAIAAHGCVNEVPFGSTALSMVTFAVGLQIGYLLGVAARLTLAGGSGAGIIEQRRLRDQPARTF